MQQEVGVVEVEMGVKASITVFGPASLSNMGPGYDALGLCVGGWGDEIEAWRTDEPGISIEYAEGPVAWDPPHEPDEDTAGVAAATVLAQTGAGGGLRLRLRKGIPLGSGVGGSAASAVAGAWAANLALGQPFTKVELVEAVLAGEAVASGSRHGDNVLPALFGGLVLVSATEPSRYRRIPLPRPLPIALVVPEVSILTKEARAILPQQVPLRDAVHNAAELAFLVDAFRCGDWETVGQRMMADRLVEPVRARLVPCYDAVRQAALDAGAFGCALTGSGPALYALAPGAADAARISEAMVEASRAVGIPATGLVTEADDEGARATGGND